MMEAKVFKQMQFIMRVSYFFLLQETILYVLTQQLEKRFENKGSHWKIAQRGLVFNKTNNEEFIYFTDNDKLKSISAKNGKLNNNFAK